MQFFKSEDGAVTVDWVVLTAALVGLGLAAMSVVSSGVEQTSTDIEGQLKTKHIINSSFTVQYDAQVTSTRNSFLTPRCRTSGATAANCYQMTRHTVVLETEDGREITHQRNISHYRGGELNYVTASWRDQDGNEEDPTTLAFKGDDCVTTGTRSNYSNEICLSEGFPDVVAQQPEFNAENYPSYFEPWN